MSDLGRLLREFMRRDREPLVDWDGQRRREGYEDELGSSREQDSVYICGESWRQNSRWSKESRGSTSHS